MKFFNFTNRSIEFLFYSLFLLVPLVFTGNTSELFEFNKMWVTFIITILIGFFWLSKMIIARKFIFKRTILDIPILLFLLAHTVSTIFSLDSYISFWGYYSRWNGGLLSIITYSFLYWAFVSNFFNKVAITGKEFIDKMPSGKKVVKNSLIVSIVAGFITVLWALPSHFGYDPTCLVFRGSLDVACWTNDFQPTARIFGPLGQPNWLAGYLAILIPITAAFIIEKIPEKGEKLLNPSLIFYSLSFLLFYLAILYSGARSGMIATFASLILFAGIYAIANRKNLQILKNKFVIIFMLLIIAVSFFAGIRLPVVEKFSLTNVQSMLIKEDVAPQNVVNPKDQIVTSIPFGGSDSGAIRKIVWKGAVDVWKANPVIGSGVETFAFAYYQHRPVEHNSLSEWNFLYNKAHNEYLNYLATTGIVGLFSHLLFIAFVITLFLVNICKPTSKKIRYLKYFEEDAEFDYKNPILIALLSSFVSILIVNFFGFSVVISNIYLFLLPAFGIILIGILKDDDSLTSKIQPLTYAHWVGIAGLALIALFMIGLLGRFWLADVRFALGQNYQRAGEYQTAFPLLQDATNLRQEPVFMDEKAINNAFIAVGLSQQGSSESAILAQQLVTEALEINKKLLEDHPNNINFWKSRVRMLYTLSSIDPSFLPQALIAIEATSALAPTDTSVLYNWGVIAGQSNQIDKAIEILERTVEYRPRYIEARYALGLFYHDKAVNEKGQVLDKAFHQKAKAQMKFILENLDPNNTLTKESLDAWEKEL